MNLYDWAVRHGVSEQAIAELISASCHTPDAESTPRSEAYVQSIVRVEAAAHGVHLWRNNVGGGVLESGSFVRWGLANDSEQLNKRLKSSDLIGWRSVRAIDGKVIAQLVCRECKPAGWVWGATPREQAQLAWINIVNAAGGDACFVTGEGSF